MANIEKRRSARIRLTIPLMVEGVDGEGRVFQADGRTLVLNRHGGRIRVQSRLRAGDTVRITNLVRRRSSDFRVVGPVFPFSEEGGEYGVEYLHPDEDIWGIQFPPLQPGETDKSNALLECRKCGRVQLVAVSLVEVEVLDTFGILKRDCETCGATGSWSYTKKPTTLPSPAEAKACNSAPPTASGRERRRYGRIALQLPVRIRDYNGGVEITRSENISKGGFCFMSEKQYQAGEGILVTCPYSSKGDNIEIRARIAACLATEGNPRRIYGVQFLENKP